MLEQAVNRLNETILIANMIGSSKQPEFAFGKSFVEKSQFAAVEEGLVHRNLRVMPDMFGGKRDFFAKALYTDFFSRIRQTQLRDHIFIFSPRIIRTAVVRGRSKRSGCLN
jgi:hypothetical protein